MRLKEKKLLTAKDCEQPVMKLTLEALPGETIHSFQHGQCVRIGIPNSRKPSPAYFAIASSPEDEGYYDLVVKQVGVGMGHYLCQMPEGQMLEIDGPMGKGFNIDAMRGRNVILVGVGTGIAPLRSVWRSIVRHRSEYGDVSIHAGFLTKLHQLLVSETKALDEHKISVHTTLKQDHDGWGGPIGYVQESLTTESHSPENTVVCLAGMSAMVEACTEVLHQMGFADEQIMLNF